MPTTIPATTRPASTAQPTGRAGYVPSAVEVMRREAGKIQQMVEGEDMKRLIMATTWLPHPEPMTLYERPQPTRNYLTPEEFEALPESERAMYSEQVYDGYYFYTTRYGSPLAYLRPLQILHDQFASTAEPNVPNMFRGKRIVDFGFGTYGHLRLLASIGCSVTGIEVDPLLQKLYDRPEFVGDVPPSGMDERKSGPGMLSLAFGSWPGDNIMRGKVGDGYDVFMSKNTLKRGYIVPPTDREYDPKRMIQLGVEPEVFVREVARVLKPGGLFLMYNICPKQSPIGEAYKPWADGRSPFEREMLEGAGFEVLAFDSDDATKMRELAKGLGWDSGNEPMDLENDFFVLYTLTRKR